ncbi:MAG: DNA-protecting protein DprA [Clostridiales bacterium]|nr:DNA-protecting protein DprA [Clostridiales bacterium]
MDRQLLYWIWLALRCGAGSENGTYLMAKLGSPEEIYAADETRLDGVAGISPELKKALLDKNIEICKRILDFCERTNVSIMTADSDIYPQRLKNIHAKPLLLYYKGKVPKIDDNVLCAVVGTRSCTEYGEKVAYKFGAELAMGGAIVVSGMARGIDAMAARGALSVGGHTIAVLGCGIETAYPPQNRELMEEIILNGTVMTEYAPGTEPAGWNFPVRNRIISGLCQATLVVEADKRSGALITAGRAISQGRDVFAVPGKIGDRESEGTNELIREGAKVALSAKDILREYELLYPHRIFIENIDERMYATSQKLRVASPSSTVRLDPPPKYTKVRLFDDEPKKTKTSRQKEKEPDLSYLTEEERKLFSVINDKMTTDEIHRAAENVGIKKETGALLGLLTTLEIYGLIEAVPGGSYKRVKNF